MGVVREMCTRVCLLCVCSCVFFVVCFYLCVLQEEDRVCVCIWALWCRRCLEMSIRCGMGLEF